jgi:hypothetical protein
VAELAIRVPSLEALFDAWSAEPMERRPLSDEARERILDTWTQARKHATESPTLALSLPESERREGLEQTIGAAVHRDMETMAVESRHHWIRRSLRPRESKIGIVLFFVALAIGAVIDWGAGETFLGQVFVVFAWVALWAPAYRVIIAASFRLARKYFIELADADVRIDWD